MAPNHFGFLSAAPSTVKVETRSLASDDIDLSNACRRPRNFRGWASR